MSEELKVFGLQRVTNKKLLEVIARGYNYTEEELIPKTKEGKELLKIYEEYKKKYLGTFIDDSDDEYYKVTIARGNITKTGLLRRLRGERKAKENAHW